MKMSLGAEEYSAFREALGEPPVRSLRFNALKAGDFLRDELIERWALSPVPRCPDAYFYPEDARPGKDPLHEAGAYYIQEASAAAPAEVLRVSPGEYVLDLCAAPGGKSTQLAAAMRGEGILVSNEIVPSRCSILAENMERCGVSNAIITRESPDVLAGHFPGFFDAILVDAPCSGEGMFRKNPEACEQWSPQNVELCAERQDDILDSAAAMLSPGGRLCYSTCTFSEAEDEDAVERFLERHGDFTLVTSDKIMPHREAGEGQFYALFTKEGTPVPAQERLGRSRKVQPAKSSSLPDMTDILQSFYIPEGILVLQKDTVVLLPEGAPDTRGLKIQRAGLPLFTVKKNRLEPHHALAMATPADKIKKSAPLDEAQAISYIKGESFPCDAEPGWCIVTYRGVSMGTAKIAGGTLKNHYPKGLRRPPAFFS